MSELRAAVIATLIAETLEWDGKGMPGHAADARRAASRRVYQWRQTIPEEPHGVATTYAGSADLRDILWDALRQVTWIENADPSWQATHLRTLAATLTAAAEKLAKP